MSTAAFLNQDFGPESEDENFNPAPGQESDNDALGDSDNEGDASGQVNGNRSSRRASEQRGSEEEVDGGRITKPTKGNERTTNGHNIQGEGDADESSKGRRVGGLDGAGDDDEDEDEEEEDEDEDDEEAISVGVDPPEVLAVLLTSNRVDRESELGGIPGINFSMLRQKLTRRTKETKKTRKDKLTISSPTFIPTTVMKFRTALPEMIPGTEILIGNGRRTSRSMLR